MRVLYKVLILHRKENSNLDGAAIWKIDGSYGFYELPHGQYMETIDRMKPEAIILEVDKAGLWLDQLKIIRSTNPYIEIMIYDGDGSAKGEHLILAINAGLEGSVDNPTELIGTLDKWLKVNTQHQEPGGLSLLY